MRIQKIRMQPNAKTTRPRTASDSVKTAVRELFCPIHGMTARHNKFPGMPVLHFTVQSKSECRRLRILYRKAALGCQLASAKGSFGSTSAGQGAPRTLVKFDANAWSGRWQSGGHVECNSPMVRTIPRTQMCFSTSIDISRHQRAFASQTTR